MDSLRLIKNLLCSLCRKSLCSKHHSSLYLQ
nr:MAG TPA: 60S ribosomal protein L2-A [Caudoviricetes sp.]